VIRGRIVTDWRVAGGRFTLAVTIPANTTATVLVPAKAARDVTEGGRPIRRTKTVTFLRVEPAIGTGPSRAVFEVGSGTYRFDSPALSGSRSQ